MLFTAGADDQPRLLERSPTLRSRRAPPSAALTYGRRYGHAKDYNFSRASMDEDWRAGYHDAVRMLRHPRALGRPTNHEGVFTFDLSDDGCK